jgi:hypothetical protein
VTTEIISKLEAAKQQLDSAIQLLLEGQSLPAHTLAYASYSVLRDLLGPITSMQVLLKLEKSLSLRRVPEFLKHTISDRNAIFKEHSPKAVHLTVALAIMLWKQGGEAETELMREFSTLPNPHKPGHRHSEVFKLAQGVGPMTEARVQAAVTWSTTSGSVPTEIKKLSE